MSPQVEEKGNETDGESDEVVETRADVEELDPAELRCGIRIETTSRREFSRNESSE